MPNIQVLEQELEKLLEAEDVQRSPKYDYDDDDDNDVIETTKTRRGPKRE